MQPVMSDLFQGELEQMKKNQAKKKTLLKYSLIGCGTILFLATALLVSTVWYLSRQNCEDITLYQPFRSLQAKEQFLSLYDARARKWPVPSQTKTVITSYGRTFVRISGPIGAPPLVLLHGISGNSLQWIPNVAELSGSFRVYAVDTIDDYGRSVCTRKIGSPADYVKWLDELFTSLHLGNNINLAGLSYGGWLTSQYALRFPGRLDKIVLLAPAGTILPLKAGWILRAVFCALPLRYFTRNFMFWLLEDLSRRDEVGRKMVEDWADDSFLAMRSFRPKRLVNPTVLTDKDLQSLKVPVLYLVGEHEKICSAREAVTRLHKIAPQIRAEVIPNAGHDLTVVQSGLVNRKILEFLKGP
jgi:pimeloyl-ACP methyl ester carboxylesterase